MVSKYEQEISKFSKKDGILAICVWLIYMIMGSAYVTVMSRISVPWYLNVFIIICYCSFQAGIVFVIIRRQKQDISSIGLHKEKIRNAIWLGLFVSLIPVLFTVVLPGIYSGFHEHLIGILLVNFVTAFFFAAHEDVVFIGFIQTRLYGIFKTDKVAITVGAILFSLMHIPLWIIMGRFDLNNLFVDILINSLGWILMYLVFVSVFKKYYSLAPVFILHTIANYSFNFALTQFAFGFDFSLVRLILLVVVACILFWQTRRRTSKESVE